MMISDSGLLFLGHPVDCISQEKEYNHAGLPQKA